MTKPNYLIDTHCHIHEADFPLDVNEMIAAAAAAGVGKIICVGTDMKSSRSAVEMAARFDNVWAAVGVHPHESKYGIDGLAELVSAKKVIAVGEIGLDYFYNHSPRETQIEILNRQIELALKNNLPISFHVREAFDDFWPIIDNFGGQTRGVLHSFTDSISNLEKGLAREFFVGVNGIATFNKNPKQHKMYIAIPLDRMVLETDAPFLAPVPFRGKTNQPSFIPKIADFMANLCGVSFDKLAAVTTKNAESIFKI